MTGIAIAANAAIHNNVNKNSTRVKPLSRRRVRTVRRLETESISVTTANFLSKDSFSDAEAHKLLRRLAPRADAIVSGIGEDCAIVAFGNGLLALKTDPTMEGLHFESGLLDARAIARKAFLRPASDLVASMAQPRFSLVSVDFAKDTNPTFAKQILRALITQSRSLGAPLVGGHTSFHGETLSLHVMLTGECFKKPPGRCGAKPGDWLLATGAFGGSGVSGRHLKPKLRWREMRLLSTHVALHAAMDVSDGLSLDASRMADASGVALELDAASIPIHPDVYKTPSAQSPLDRALGDGEDYELLLAADPKESMKALRLAAKHQFPLARIGTFFRGRGLRLMKRKGRSSAVEPRGFVQRSIGS